MEKTAIPAPAELWREMHRLAEAALRAQPQSSALLTEAVLRQDHPAGALAWRMARKLADGDAGASVLQDILLEQWQSVPLQEAMARDLMAYRHRDPACVSLLQPFLFFKGFAAVQIQRAAHGLWRQGRQVMAWQLQSRVSELWQVDIHPAARLGGGLFLDHATGIVIGETSVIGDDVTVMHGVTLGGNGKERGDRHPKIGDRVLLSVGAKVLGNIKVGEGARVAAGAVVLRDVPPHMTVAGAPARLVAGQTPAEPADCLDHSFGV